MEKKVQKRQKYFDKLKKQLDRQATYYKNNANMFFSNAMGLGVNSVNPANPYGSNGAIMQVMQGMTPENIQKMIEQASGGQLDCSKFTPETWELIKNGGVQEATYDSDKFKKGDIINTFTGEPVKLPEGVEATQINKVASMVQQFAQMQVSNMQTQMSQMKTNYENNVSIWLEAQQEQLEAQEEWEMDLLAEEQADMEAEQQMVENRLKRIQEQKQSIEQALGQAIKDSAPKFGLA